MSIELIDTTEDDGAIPLGNVTGFVVGGPRGTVFAEATIGDGPYGATSGDFDYYTVFVEAGDWINALAYSGLFGAALDADLYLFNAAGVQVENDIGGSINYQVTTTGFYSLLVTASDSNQPDAWDSSSGMGAGSTGDYRIYLNVNGSGAAGDDFSTTVNGSSDDDVINGRFGGDTVSGLQGDDVLDGGPGSDIVEGGSGDDILIWAPFDPSSTDSDTYNMGSTDEVDTIEIHSTIADGIILDGSQLNTGLSTLTIGWSLSAGKFSFIRFYGTSADNAFTVINVDNTGRVMQMAGFAGDDNLSGCAGTDQIDGGDDDDTISGNGDNYRGDELDGGDGNDKIYAGDSVSHASAFGASIQGGNGKDLVVGSDAVDNLRGGSDNDRLLGWLGGDTLRGNDGDDRLTGGGGPDTMEGGAGNDLFVFQTAADSGVGANRDTITDFSVAGSAERIDLKGVFGGTLAFLGTAGFTNAVGEVRYKAVGGNTLVQVDLDTDKAAEMEILLIGKKALHAADFHL